MRRINLILSLFVLLTGLIIFRLFWWQIIQGEKLAAAAKNQRLNAFSLFASRGTIKTADGYPLATNKTTYLLFAEPAYFSTGSGFLAQKIASFFYEEEDSLLKRRRLEKLKETELKNKLTDNKLRWIPLERGLLKEEKEKIEADRIAGLGFEREETRYYPEASVAAHLLGFVGGSETGEKKGYFGVEGFYDRQLQGAGGDFLEETDVFGRPIVFGEFSTEAPEDGRDLILFLDRRIQFIVEENLKKGISDFGAKGGLAIAIEPVTGGVLAMASFPNYDPQSWTSFPKENFRNPSVADSFEPGSIFKPIIMAAALNEKVVTPGAKCPICGGPRQIGDYWVRTFNNKYHPDLTMTEVLENSDNTGMIFVGEKLGKDKLYEYIKNFGFGSFTGIDLQEEQEGKVKEKKDWYPIDSATVAFGQGIAVTPIQMIRAFTAIANGGKLLTPRAVKKIIDKKREITVEPKILRQIIKPEVSRVLTEMLVSVVLKSPLRFPLEAHPELRHYRIAAKSGTAQIPIAGHYDPKKTIGSVIGFAPAEDPRFVLLVVLWEPGAAPWGSDTAGPIFFNIMSELLLSERIPPAR